MVSFDGWCGRKDQEVKGHRLTILTGVRTKLSFARDELAAAHGASEADVAATVAACQALGLAVVRANPATLQELAQDR